MENKREREMKKKKKKYLETLIVLWIKYGWWK